MPCRIVPTAYLPRIYWVAPSPRSAPRGDDRPARVNRAPLPFSRLQERGREGGRKGPKIPSIVVDNFDTILHVNTWPNQNIIEEIIDREKFYWDEYGVLNEWSQKCLTTSRCSPPTTSRPLGLSPPGWLRHGTTSPARSGACSRRRSPARWATFPIRRTPSSAPSGCSMRRLRSPSMPSS